MAFPIITAAEAAELVKMATVSHFQDLPLPEHPNSLLRLSPKKR